uniref:Bifunctional inhibitor/plant lipid transfer protein/seed storage helical domain-containing protein n=1 Tax=Rhizophora mucronata TaxID=61149 RepID=A0A2P2INU1_RHIMU
MASWKMLPVVMAVAFFVSSTTLTDAQSAIPSCASKLIPCAPYLNGTMAPAASCCNPIKEAVKNELSCLCNLYSTPDFLSSIGVNVTKALALTQKCGVTADLSACNKATAPTATASSPPAVPGNDGRRMAWSGFTSLVLLLASFSLHH